MRFGGHSGVSSRVVGAVALLSCALPAAAAASEHVSLPFVCRYDGERVKLVPARKRSYQIIGQRSVAPVTGCEDGSPAVCRTIPAHRFTMLCAGRRVPWWRVALAIGGRHNARLVMEAGQPLLVVKTTRSGSDVTETRFRMPSGSAPLEIFGAEIVNGLGVASFASAEDRLRADAAAEPAQPATGRTRTERIEDSARDGAVRSADAARARQRRLIDRTITSEPLPDIGNSAPVPRAEPGSSPEAAGSWHTVVRSEAGAGTAGLVEAGGIASSAPMARDMTVWAMLTALIGLAGWLTMSRPTLARSTASAAFTAFSTAGRRLQQGVSGAGAVPARWAEALGSMRRTRFAKADQQPGIDSDAAGSFAAGPVETLVRQVEAEVRGVDGSLPIRQVLDEEMARVRQRLTVAVATSRDGGAAGRLAAPAYRVITRDLDRIRRIADSARRSIGLGAPGAGGSRMPENRDQAYALLGLNPSASPATAKKLIDALRMSWHPDLAADHDDRIAREERIRQINVALELIDSRGA